MKWPRRLILFTAAAGVLSAVTGALAETASLEMKRLESRSRYSGVMPGSIDFFVRYSQSQGFYMQMGDSKVEVAPRPDQAAFKQLIKKEPAAYEGPYPFRGVAKLGGKSYGFVFDSVGPSGAKKDEDKPETKEKAEKVAKTEVKAIPYNRLYFDINGNGDLTDDKPVEAMPSPVRIGYPAGYAQCEFPRVDITLTVDGTQIDYAFFFTVFSNASGEYHYASASLNSAAYREGEITLDGKKRKVYLLDYNSNGRFDDALMYDKSVRGPGGQVYPRDGDIFLIDPDVRNSRFFSYYDMTSSDDRYLVSKLTSIEGRYYDMQVSPAGDRLTLEPSKTPLGAIGNPNGKFRALVCNEHNAVVAIRGDKDRPAAVPEGEWKLLSYTIDLTAAREAAEKKAKEDAEKKAEGKGEKTEGSLLGALTKALIPTSRPSMVVGSRYTIVQANATHDMKPVAVRKGETALMAFGPPYLPKVEVLSAQPDGKAYLQMSLLGSSGEIVNNMMIDGNRPQAAPEFTIKDPKGDVVEKGKFEFG